ncbi:hypothetical protein BLOT_000485 [Blomia tropicalis]|nr:hypothetical protein BLOT_000485 [Blomia tropicalis]
MDDPSEESSQPTNRSMNVVERRLGWDEFVRAADNLVQVSAAVDTSPWLSNVIQRKFKGASTLQCE